MADLFGIGLTGLRASQTQLAVTGQNITNVNTPGYSRQSALQATQVPSYTGAGYIGNGTKVVDVSRIYNQFLTNQVRTSTSTNSEVQAFQSQLEQLNTLVSSSATGITPGLQSYFDALQTAIEDPANLPARQLVLSEAEGLASRFNTVHSSLNSQNQFISQQMTTLADQTSRLATSIAQYNDSIAIASANGAQPNDLLDARDEAVRQLERAVQLRPQDAVINDHLGDAYWKVGRRLEARFQWERVRTLDAGEDLLEQVETKLEDGLSAAEGDGDAAAAEAEAEGEVALNHPHCAKFCVLGGASCSA